jgi:uncharacterized Zn-binding protein involved in type VI secretion
MPPAARVTDMHTCPMVTGVVPHVGGPILPPGAPTVLIDFLPAANVTTMATCVGPPDVIIMGSTGVLINFLPAARLGDPTAHGGVIILGSPTCIIGEMGSPSPGAGGMGGIVAGLGASGVSQLQQNLSKYSTSGSGGPTANTSPKPSTLANSEFNGVKADRVRSGTNGKVAVIGRSMANAVNPYTKGLQTQSNVETFTGDKISPAALAEWNTLKKQHAPKPIPEDALRKSLMFKENQAWAEKLADQGYTVVDVDNPTNEKPSPFYEMEKQTLFGDDSASGAKK